MASNIQSLLNDILNAVYGRDVRNAIHDAIEICYDDVEEGKTIAETAAASVGDAATRATNAANAANAAATSASNAATAANSAASAATTAVEDIGDAVSDAVTAARDATSAASSASQAASDASEAAAEAIEAVEEAQEIIEEIHELDIDVQAAIAATSAANTAASAANTAATNANNAKDAANLATQSANAARDAANSAASSCTAAITAANTAATNANNAKDAANTAATNADLAKTAANSAASSATTAASSATNAATNANAATTSANAKISAMDAKIFDAEAATNSANTAAASANSAVISANAAAATITGLTVDSEDVGSNIPAEAILQTINGHKNIHFLLRQGQPGASYTIKGDAYATVADLQADVTNPEVGDQYNVGSSPPYHVYRWTGTTWEDQGTIGSDSIPFTAQDVQAIQAGREVQDASIKVTKYEALNYLINTLIPAGLSGKVDKINGKGLSTNDFTTSYMNEISAATSAISNLSSSKVDKITGKGLSTNDYTAADQSKVTLIGTGNLDTTASTLIGAINELVLAISALNTALDAKAPLASPALTGSPTASTPGTTNSSTRIATTAYVQANFTAKANIYVTNVSASSWTQQGTPTYSGYPYRCALSSGNLANVTSSMYAEVVFAPTEALSGNYAPVCQTYDGGVYIYSKVNTSITIPSIVVMR